MDFFEEFFTGNWTRKVVAHILIKGVPVGKPPLWVRENWEGLSLPIVGLSNENSRGADICSDEVRVVGRGFFLVPKDEALDILKEKSPAAADWFEENDQESDQGTYFSFGFNEVEFVLTDKGYMSNGDIEELRKNNVKVIFESEVKEEIKKKNKKEPAGSLKNFCSKFSLWRLFMLITIYIFSLVVVLLVLGNTVWATIILCLITGITIFILVRWLIWVCQQKDGE